MARNIEVNQDLEHLRLLALFHYILGGLQAAVGCLPLIYAGLGIAFLSGAFENERNPPPREIGYLFLFVGLFVSLLLWGLASLKILAGRSLSQHKRYTFCFVMACIDCLNMPYSYRRP